MHFSSVGHTESCKNEKKSLVFSGKDLLSHFLFYLSLLLLIKIFLVFWFEAKNIATWSHWWQIALPVFSSGLGGPAIQMSVLQELPSHGWGRSTVWDGKPQATLTPYYAFSSMESLRGERTKQMDNKFEFSFLPVSVVYDRLNHSLETNNSRYDSCLTWAFPLWLSAFRVWHIHIAGAHWRLLKCAHG